MKRIYSSKGLLKMAGGGMHPPHPPWIRSWLLFIQPENLKITV